MEIPKVQFLLLFHMLFFLVDTRILIDALFIFKQYLFCLPTCVFKKT